MELPEGLVIALSGQFSIEKAKKTKKSKTFKQSDAQKFLNKKGISCWQFQEIGKKINDDDWNVLLSSDDDKGKKTAIYKQAKDEGLAILNEKWLQDCIDKDEIIQPKKDHFHKRPTKETYLEIKRPNAIFNWMESRDRGTPTVEDEEDKKKKEKKERERKEREEKDEKDKKKREEKEEKERERKEREEKEEKKREKEEKEKKEKEKKKREKEEKEEKEKKDKEKKDKAKKDKKNKDKKNEDKEDEDVNSGDESQSSGDESQNSDDESTKENSDTDMDADKTDESDKEDSDTDINSDEDDGSDKDDESDKEDESDKDNESEKGNESDKENSDTNMDSDVKKHKHLARDKWYANGNKKKKSMYLTTPYHPDDKHLPRDDRKRQDCQLRIEFVYKSKIFVTDPKYLAYFPDMPNLRPLYALKVKDHVLEKDEYVRSGGHVLDSFQKDVLEDTDLNKFDWWGVSFDGQYGLVWGRPDGEKLPMLFTRTTMKQAFGNKVADAQMNEIRRSLGQFSIETMKNQRKKQEQAVDIRDRLRKRKKINYKE